MGELLILIINLNSKIRVYCNVINRNQLSNDYMCGNLIKFGN